jgi:hypothetical protein
MTVLASISGFIAAQFVAALYSEQFAEWYMLGYENGFYASVPAPEPITPGTITLDDRELILNYCTAADAERLAALPAKPGG